MDKIGAYQLLSIEDANLVDRYANRSFDRWKLDELANLVLESRAQQPPLTITAPDGSQIPVDPSNAVRIDPTRSSFRVEI